MAGCGSCSMCCKLIEIDDSVLKKAPNIWCKNCSKPGCRIYNDRPSSCQAYECVYLQSGSQASPLPESFRPDKCGVIFDITEDCVFAIARVDPKDIQKLNSIEARLMIAFLSNEHSVIASTGRRKKIIHLRAEGIRKLQELGIDHSQVNVWFDDF